VRAGARKGAAGQPVADFLRDAEQAPRQPHRQMFQRKVCQPIAAEQQIHRIHARIALIVRDGHQRQPHGAGQGCELQPLDFRHRRALAHRAAQRGQVACQRQRETQRQRLAQPLRRAALLLGRGVEQGEEIEADPFPFQPVQAAGGQRAAVVHPHQQHAHIGGRMADHLAHMGFDPADLEAARVEWVDQH
jgi:hypothetical protein